MKRAFSITAAIVVATLGCAWGLNACAREPAASQSPAKVLEKWQPGINYTQLPSPQPTGGAPGRTHHSGAGGTPRGATRGILRTGECRLAGQKAQRRWRW